MTASEQVLGAALPRARRFSVPWMPTLPLSILVVLVLAAVAAPLLTPHNPTLVDLPSAMRPPVWMDGGSSENILGTDGFGRDILSRLVHGARVSLSVAALSMLVAAILGAVLGILSGLVGGWLDSLLMRIVDMALALPLILVAMALAVALGPSFSNLVLVIGLLLWPGVARLVRGETMLLKQQQFVRYASAVGVRRWVIASRHILPNVAPTLLVATTLEVGHIILVEASLSFLGAGIPPPAPSWGVMISDGRALLATGWWISLFPGLAIMIAVLTFNMLGDWLRDRLDPELKTI